MVYALPAVHAVLVSTLRLRAHRQATLFANHAQHAVPINSRLKIAGQPMIGHALLATLAAQGRTESANARARRTPFARRAALARMGSF